MSTNFLATGTLANVGGGLTPSTGNNGYTTSSAQLWLRRRFIDVLEETLYFYRYGTMEEIKNGYLTHSWARMEKTQASAFTKTTGGGGLTASTTPTAGYTVGITPADTAQPVGTITVNPEQYVVKNTIADMVIDFTVLDIIKKGMEHFANAAARRIDVEIQNVIYNKLSATAGATYFVDHASPKTITTIAGYEGSGYIAGNIGNAVMRVSDVAALATKLDNNSAPSFGEMAGNYMLVVHTRVAHDLMTQEGQTGFVNIFAQTPEQVQRIVRGYVGTVYGMNVVKTPHVQTKESSSGGSKVTLFPSYAIAKGLYGVLKYRFNTYYVPTSSIDTSDPLAQRAVYGVKFTFNSVVLDTDCGIVAYSNTMAPA